MGEWAFCEGLDAGVGQGVVAWVNAWVLRISYVRVEVLAVRKNLGIPICVIRLSPTS